MNLQRYTIKLYLKKTSEKIKGFPIYLRLIVNREKAEYFTNEYVKEEQWNPVTELSSNSKILNERLINIKKRVSGTIEEFEKKNKVYSAKQIIHHLKGIGENYSTILFFIKSFIEEMKQTPATHSPDKIKHYTTTYYYLIKFLLHKRGKKIENDDLLKEYDTTKIDLEIRSIDLNMIKEFDDFLKNYESKISKRTLLRNYVNKHHQRLNYILNKALAEEKTTINPYSDFILHYDKTQRAYLTLEEIAKLEEGNLGGNDGLIKVRDIFLFSIYTGLRFGEAITLTPKNIIKSGNKSLINYQIEKKYVNSNNIPEIKKLNHSIPLLKKAEEIYEKYKYLHNTTGYILPTYSNQKVNAYLKVIADLCGINKSLTHHSARHTLATTILLENDVPIEIVSKWLGHEKISTTQIYGHISPKLLQKQAEKLDRKLK